MRRIGRYVLLSRIASGTLGDVFLARRAAPEEEIAVKLIKSELARDLRFARLLLTEAPTAMRFAHPASVRVLDVDRDASDLYVASDLEHGQPLSAVLKRAQIGQVPLDQQLVCWIGAELASALDQAHKTPWFQSAPVGMVHGGVSLRSAIITYKGEAKLLGLGMGRARLATQPSLARLPYLAPELLGEDRQPHPRSDIYSLGVVLYDALANRQLFRRATREETNAAVKEGRIPPLAPALRVEPKIAGLVEGMMSMQIDARPHDLVEVERVLRSAAGRSSEECKEALGQMMRTIFAGEIQAERRVVAAALRKKTPSTLEVTPDEARTDDAHGKPNHGGDPFQAALGAMLETYGTETGGGWSGNSQQTPRAEDTESVATLTDPPEGPPATDKMPQAVSVSDSEPKPGEPTTLDLSMKRRIARYQTLGVIHRSAHALLFKARDPNVGRTLLLKVMDPDFVSDPRLRRDDWVALFKREARIAGRINHPGVRQLLDAGRDGNTFFIAYALIEGVTLHEALGARERIDQERVRRIAVDVAAALDHLHTMGVVHADVRSTNVLLAEDGRAYLTDLSLSHESGGAEHPLLAANVEVASPEYLAGFGYGPKADQFALGMLVYEMLTGERPFRGTDPPALTREIQTKNPAPPHAVDPRIDKALSEALMRMLEKDPAQRFESLRTVVGALGGRLTAWGTPASGAPPPGSPLEARGSELTTEPELMKRIEEDMPTARTTGPAGRADVVFIDDAIPTSVVDLFARAGARAAIYRDVDGALAAMADKPPRIVVATQGAARDPRALRREIERISSDIELRLVPDVAARILGPALSTEELVLSLIAVYARTTTLGQELHGADAAQAARAVARRLGAGARAEMLAPLAVAARELAARLHLPPSADEITGLVPGEVVALFPMIDRALGDTDESAATILPVAAQIAAVVEFYFSATRPLDDRARISPRRAVLDLRQMAGRRVRGDVVEALVDHLREVISALDLPAAEPALPRILIAGPRIGGLVSALEFEGFAIEKADDGHVAWEKLRRAPYRGAIVDRALPGRDGLSLLRLCRAHPDTEQVPFLILAPQKDAALESEVARAGAAEIIDPSAAVESIRAKVGRWIGVEP